MSLNAPQLRELVVRPTLEWLGLWSQAAENLVMGTAAQESRLTYLRQLPNGPALGLWQMEPATHRDIYENYLKFRPDRAALVRALCITGEAGELVWNLRYAAAMCRIHYRRVPEPLPDPHDVWALGHYWDTHYNRNPDKGFPHEFVDNYRLVQ